VVQKSAVWPIKYVSMGIREDVFDLGDNKSIARLVYEKFTKQC